MRTILFIGIAMLVMPAFAEIETNRTGGTIFNLFPSPKNLKGKIHDDIYIAKDYSFTVKVPHKKGTNEFRYMQISEAYMPFNGYVSFGPTAGDSAIYRVSASQWVTEETNEVSFVDASATLLKNWKLQFKNNYGNELVEVLSEESSVNGKPARHFQFSQIANEGKYYRDHKAKLMQDVYFIKYEFGMAFVSIERLGDWAEEGANGFSALDYAESIKVFPPVPGKGENDFVSLEEWESKSLTDLRGRWEGVTETLFDPNGNNLPTPEGSKYRFEIGCDGVKMFLRANGQWKESGDDQLNVKFLDSAVVVSGASSRDVANHLGSTHLIRIDENTIEMTRVSSNQNKTLRVGHPWQTFSTLEEGTLNRVKDWSKKKPCD